MKAMSTEKISGLSSECRQVSLKEHWGNGCLFFGGLTQVTKHLAVKDGNL